MPDVPLEVIVARSAGTCFGVRGAIEIAQREKKPILGPLVHNPQIVGDLARSGIPILERYSGIDGLRAQEIDEVIITAHGYPRELKDRLRNERIKVHDATCPVLLRWVYTKIQRFEARGYAVLLVGDPDHAEIIASRSYGSRIFVVYSDEAVDALPADLGPCVAICQTTITREKFQHLVERIRASKYPDLKAVDTRCKPVKNQQEAVDHLAQWVDAMLIVGGLNSSNTQSLARISRRYLPRHTYHIDSPDAIDRAWLDGVNHLGVGAGTSTPHLQIDAVKSRVAELTLRPVVFRKDSDDDGIPEDADVSQEI